MAEMPGADDMVDADGLDQRDIRHLVHPGDGLFCPQLFGQETRKDVHLFVPGHRHHHVHVTDVFQNFLRFRMSPCFHDRSALFRRNNGIVEEWNIKDLFKFRYRFHYSIIPLFLASLTLAFFLSSLLSLLPSF